MKNLFKIAYVTLAMTSTFAMANSSPSINVDVPVVKNAVAVDSSIAATSGATVDISTPAPVIVAPDINKSASVSGTGQAASTGGSIDNINKTKTVTKDNVTQTTGQNGSGANNGGTAQSAQGNGVNAIIGTSSPYPSYGVESLSGPQGGGSTPAVQVQGGQNNAQASGNQNFNQGTLLGNDAKLTSVSSLNSSSPTNVQSQTLNGDHADTTLNQGQSQSIGVAQTSLTFSGEYSPKTINGSTGITIGFSSLDGTSLINGANSGIVTGEGDVSKSNANVALASGANLANSGGVTTTSIPVTLTNSLNNNDLLSHNSATSTTTTNTSIPVALAFDGSQAATSTAGFAANLAAQFGGH